MPRFYAKNMNIHYKSKFFQHALVLRHEICYTVLIRTAGLCEFPFRAAGRCEPPEPVCRTQRRAVRAAKGSGAPSARGKARRAF